jgi:peroxiredoxin
MKNLIYLWLFIGLGLPNLQDHTLAAEAAEEKSTVNPVGVTDNNASKKNERQEDWKRELSQVAIKENTAIFFDIGSSLMFPPPNMNYSKSYGAETMRALALSTSRIWKQIDGIQFFSDFQPSSAIREDDLRFIVDWIGGLSRPQRDAILKGDLKFNQLDEVVQQALRHLIQDADMQFVLLDKKDAAYLQLKFLPKLTFKSPVDNRQFHIYLRDSDIFKSPENMSSDDGPDQGIEPLEKFTPASLDFGEGKVLTYAEILRQASQNYRIEYTIPNGAADDYYFVSGQFTRQAFEALVKTKTEIANTITPKVSATSSYRRNARALLQSLIDTDWQNLRDQSVRVSWLDDQVTQKTDNTDHPIDNQPAAKQRLAMRDFLEGKTFTAAELSRGRPKLAANFSLARLDPSAPVILSPAFLLSIGSEGRHRVSFAAATSNGKQVPVLAPNQELITIDSEPIIDKEPKLSNILPRAEDDPQSKIATPQNKIKVGQAAPDFSVIDANGKAWKLTDLKGQKTVVLTFFPKCFTGGCANHLSSLRDHQAEFDKNDVQILAVSVDPAEGEKGQKAFASQWKLMFPLIPDTERTLSKLYGAVQQNDERSARMTFLIDKQGIVRYVDTNVNVQAHGADVLAKLRDLGMVK